MLGVVLLALSMVSLPFSSARSSNSPQVSADRFNPVNVPFEYFGRHIFVTLSLNGAPGMVFLLDTGSPSNILNMRTSVAMGLKSLSIQQQKGLGLGPGKVYVAAAKDIDARIGNIQVADQMAIIDLCGLEGNFGHRVDGILGFPFLQKFVVVLDFDEHALTLLPARKYHYHGDGDMLSLLNKATSASIPITLDDSGHKRHRAHVQLDTGSDTTLLLYPQYVQDAHLESAFLSNPVEQAYGLGGFFPIQLGLLKSLSMGRTEASRLPIFQLQNNSGINVDKGLVGIIGNSFLGRFRKIIFDVHRGHVIFEPMPTSQVSANRHTFPAVNVPTQ